MKSIKQLLCGVAVLLAASCAKEKVAAPTCGEGISQIAASWGDEKSKTVLGEDGTSVLWSPNDEISVFYNTAGVKFTALNTQPVDQTMFVSSQAIIFGGTEGYIKNYLYGVYPYSSANAQEGDKITLTVPADQTAVEGSFGRGAFPSVGRSRDTNIAFYNVCGGVRFTFCQSDIKKIVLKGKNNEILAGKVKVQFDENGKPVVSDVVNGKKSITLYRGSTFRTGKWYYMSVLPVTFSGEGLSFEFTKSTGERGTKTIVSDKEIKRSLFGSIENIDSNVEFAVRLDSIFISPAEVIVAPLSNYQLSLAILPADAKYGWIKWSSSDSAIATVDESGMIVGKKDGKCTITAVSDNDKTSSCEVYVCQSPVITNDAGEVSYSTAVFNGTYNDITGAESASKEVFFLYSNTETTLDGLKANGTKVSSSLSGASFRANANGLSSKTPYYYVAALTIFGQTVYGGVKSFTTEEFPKDKPVDLGLSVKWAPCNIGASSPEDYGLYFAWGDVVGQIWDGSSCSGEGFKSYPEYELDDNNNLKPAYDAAHVLLGGSWRMPTETEFQELIDNCSSEWTTVNGVYGRMFTSMKSGYTDKSIFLPAAGDIYGSYSSRLHDAGEGGYYWSSTFGSGCPRFLFFVLEGEAMNDHRYYNNGLSVRPVSE